MNISELTAGALTAAHRKIVEEVAGILADEYGEFSLYVTGSVAAGLESTTSDLDLVAVIATDDATLEFPERDFLGPGGFTCDLQTVTRGRVRSWFQNFESWHFEAGDYGSVFFLRRSVREVSRFLLGIPLLGVEWLSEQRPLLNLTSFRRAYIALHLADVSTLARDTAGFLESGDILTAWETSALALRVVADAALGACGNFNYSEKFLLRRITDDPSTASLADLLWHRIYGLPESQSQDALVNAVKARQMLTADLTAHIYLFGWDAGTWQPFREPLTNRLERVRRCIDDIVIRAEDAAVIIGRHARRVTTADGLLWSLCDGTRSMDQLALDFAACIGQKPTVTRRWLHSEVDALTEIGLFEICP
jgi:hypothetical protein